MIDKSSRLGKDAADSAKSCDPTITRKEFIDTVVKRAALAGGLVAGYKVIDKFLVPPAYAQTSGGGGPGLGGLPSNTASDTINPITHTTD
ncbi:MAG TPA: hypothetical protein V6C81_01555 [Planktothrix sp.]